MDGEAHITLVPPLRTTPALPVTAVADRRRADLPVGVTQVRDWPARMALIIGSTPRPQVLASLNRFGFSPVVVPIEQAAEMASIIGPLTFLVIGADAMDGDRAVEAVRAVRRYSPSARCLLAGRPERCAPVELVRAVRAGIHDVVDPDDPVALATTISSGLAEAGIHRERVLAIGAHPDDVEIGCAGTLLDHRLRGDRITILTLSRGAVGGDQHARAEEAALAAEAIGAQLLLGDLPDTQVSEGVETIRLIETVVRALDPSVVYVHSRHDNHQDHRAVNIATTSATRGVRRVFAYQSPSATNEFTPTQFVSIDPVVRRKIDVLSLFDSQNGRSYLEPELVVDASRYWARHLGANARYAEPFEVVRSVGDLRQSANGPPAAGSTFSWPLENPVERMVEA